MPGTAVVFVTHRRALSAKACATLPSLNGASWVHYKDVSGQIDLHSHPLLVVQYESLSRVVGFEDPNLKIILVLDEFNSTCHQMQGTYGAPSISQQSFLSILEVSSKVVAMDGCFDQDRLDIFEKYIGQKAHLIHNQFKSRRKNEFKQTRDVAATRRFIIERLALGENIISPCMAKGLAEKLYQEVVAHFGDSKKVLLFTRDSPWDGSDVNETWRQANLVIHTSTIDCGISFEIGGHFHHCVAFFDDQSGPTHETALQMLSRSRDTSSFILCITSVYKKPQQTDKDTVLDERGVLANSLSDREFYGILHARLGNRTRDWATCNPYLATKIMQMVVERKAANDMTTHLLELLQHDGAKIVTDYKFPDLAPVVPLPTSTEAKDVPIPGTDLEAKANRLKVIYNYSGFTADDEATLKLYDRPSKISAYRNLTMLTRLGMNFMEALTQKTRDLNMLQEAIRKAEETNAFNPCIVSKIEAIVGMEDGNSGPYDLYNNQLASMMCEMVTGERDPFALPKIAEVKIAERLDCSIMRVSTGGRKGKVSYMDQLCLSQEKKEAFLNLFDQWVGLERRLHATQSLRRRAGPLSLIKAIYLLSHVLTIAYDSEFKRDDSVKWNGKVRSYTYSLYLSADFPRLNADLIGDKSKPYLSPWPLAPPGDLSGRDLLELHYTRGLMQPGFVFLKRMAANDCHRSLEREEQCDIARALKRHKTSHSCM